LIFVMGIFGVGAIFIEFKPICLLFVLRFVDKTIGFCYYVSVFGSANGNDNSQSNDDNP